MKGITPRQAEGIEDRRACQVESGEVHHYPSRLSSVLAADFVIATPTSTYRGKTSPRGSISAISAINFLMSKLPKELKSFATRTKAPGPPITLFR
jgi:hypothetical protein